MTDLPRVLLRFLSLVLKTRSDSFLIFLAKSGLTMLCACAIAIATDLWYTSRACFTGRVKKISVDVLAMFSLEISCISMRSLTPLISFLDGFSFLGMRASETSFRALFSASNCFLVRYRFIHDPRSVLTISMPDV